MTVRMRCNKIIKDKSPVALVQYKEIPYSKFFGYIASHIFQSMRLKNNSYEKIEETRIELFRKYPFEFSIAFKNKSIHGQGDSADVSDFQTLKGTGYGSKPSELTRRFNKQVIVLFKFVEEPEWIKEFDISWNHDPVPLRGSMYTDKGSVKELQEIINQNLIEFDEQILYYYYDNYERSPVSKSHICNSDKMLVALNTRDTGKSLYIENLRVDYYDSCFSLNDLITEMNYNMDSILNVIGDNNESI
jgi:hypothetical protein